MPAEAPLRIQADSSSMATSRSTPSCRKTHSQTVITLHPASRRRCEFSASRDTFRLNFSAHNSLFAAGIVAYRQPSWRCQKQPFTKTTARYFVNFRSGLPGKPLTDVRYRNPSRCNECLTTISGRVSKRGTDAIIRERVSRSTVSVMNQPRAYLRRPATFSEHRPSPV